MDLSALIHISRMHCRYRYVRLAAERGVIASLLVSDSVLRARDTATRRAYVSLIEDTRAAGEHSRYLC